MSDDRCVICGRGDRLQPIGRFGSVWCLDCIGASEKRATAPIVKSVEPTDDPRVVTKAYRNHKSAIGMPVADYDADGILCRALERSADRIEALETELAAATKHAQLLNKMLGEAEACTERLREALKPFANIKADDGDTFEGYNDDVIIKCEITVGDLKKARKAMEDDKQ